MTHVTDSAASGPAAAPVIAAHLGPGWREHAEPAWLQGWDPIPFALDGGLTHVVAMGEGPALALLAPSPGYKEAWVACAARLARAFRVVTYDQRVRFDGTPRWDALLRDLERVLDAFAPGAIAVAGHSMGGALAQTWALWRPDRVTALVLSSSFTRLYDPPANWFARYLEQPVVVASQRLLPPDPARALARWFARRGAWVYDPRCDDRVLDFLRFCMRDCPAAYARSALRLLLTHDTRRTIGGIRCPTLILVGERESPFTRPAADELHRLIAGSDFAISPGASHLHLLSNPEWAAETITRWLGTRPRP